MGNRWIGLAEGVLGGKEITDEQALSILNCDDDELLQLLDGAFKIRKKHFGKKVKLNMIINTKSGFCPENCGYCSQSSISTAPIKAYPMVNKETILKGAEQAHKMNAGTYCIVASGRGPTNRDIDTVVSAVTEIKDNYHLKICACLGILKPEQANRLKEAGVDRYNHNLNTSKEHQLPLNHIKSYQNIIRGRFLEVKNKQSSSDPSLARI